MLLSVSSTTGIAIDVIIVGLILIFGFIGLRKGFFKSVLAMISTLAVIIISIFCASPLAKLINKIYDFTGLIAGKLCKAIASMGTFYSQTIPEGVSGKDIVNNIPASTNGFLKIPEIKLDDNTNIQKLLWILPAEIDIVSLWQSEGTIPAVRALYKLRGNQIPFGLEKVFGYPNIKETDITATFYLNGNCLRMSELIVCKKGERILQISVEQNRNVLQNTLRFIVRNEVAEEESGEIAIFLNTDGSEQWKIEGGQNDVSIHWIPTSGELRMDKRNNTLAVYYQAYENGFSIKTENIQNLIRFLEIWNTEGAEWNAGCKMDITKGADFQLPKLKNLNEWSLEDFVIILDWLDVLME